MRIFLQDEEIGDDVTSSFSKMGMGDGPGVQHFSDERF